jgi:two-component system, cell cycle sensor histidine kinase and response regulator CckA
MVALLKFDCFMGLSQLELHRNRTLGNQTVLVVDDNRPVRALMLAILLENRLDALEAKSGSEALQIAANEHVDLVLTDVVMPGMSGPELISHLKERGLVKRWLLVSGYPGEALTNAQGLSERLPLLGKPFTAEQLLRTIHEIFDS